VTRRDKRILRPAGGFDAGVLRREFLPIHAAICNNIAHSRQSVKVVKQSILARRIGLAHHTSPLPALSLHTMHRATPFQWEKTQAGKYEPSYHPSLSIIQVTPLLPQCQPKNPQKALLQPQKRPSQIPNSNQNRRFVERIEFAG
jgi:hypothetical protein